jgi:hypothetical protein
LLRSAEAKLRSTPTRTCPASQLLSKLTRLYILYTYLACCPTCNKGNEGDRPELDSTDDEAESKAKALCVPDSMHNSRFSHRKSPRDDRNSIGDLCQLRQLQPTVSNLCMRCGAIHEYLILDSRDFLLLQTESARSCNIVQNGTRKTPSPPISLMSGLSVDSFSAQLAATLSRTARLEMKAISISVAYWFNSLHRACK